MTDAFASIDEFQPVKRDRYQRYLLPDPDKGGKEIPFTRVTTFASSVADMYGLHEWEKRLVVKGVGMRPDLYALACSTPVEDKGTLSRVAKDAKEVAGGSEGANKGTALHSFTESVDRGLDAFAPENFAGDVAAYRKALSDAGIKVLKQYIERIVVIPQYRLAGQLDRILQWLSFGSFIGDLKTGKDLSYSWGDIAIQLSCYANAVAMWDPVNQCYEDMPKLDLARAIVMHLPAEKSQCDLYWVDIAAGWEMAETCMTVRQWRSRKNLATPFKSPDVQFVQDAEVKLLRADPEPLNGGEVSAALAAEFPASLWFEKLRVSRSRAELSAVWKQAEAVGEWTPELEAFGQKIAERF